MSVRFALAAALALSTLLPACQRESSQVRPVTQPSGKATPSTTNTKANATTTTAPDSSPTRGSYLLTIDEARRLNPLFLDYIVQNQAPGPEFGQVSADEGTRAFLEQQVTRALALPAFAPSRTASVVLIASDAINASMDAYQVMRVNTGLIAAANAPAALGVLCHEIAHSARNHAGNSPAPALLAIQERAIAANSDYLARQYDMERRIYTHDRAGYAEAYQSWAAYKAAFETTLKKDESVADIVGAKICARLGLSPELFAEEMFGAQGLLACNPAAVFDDGPVNQPDGWTLTGDFMDVLQQLFILNSHPSNCERAEQFAALKSVLPNDPAADKAFYRNWVTGYAALKAASAGFALLDDAEPAFGRLMTGTGEVILVPRKGHGPVGP